MRFNFVATIQANGQDTKIPAFREIKTAKANGISMNLIAVAEQNNRAFMELAGFQNDVIKTYDTDGNKIEVSWDDRNDGDIVKSIANYRKNVITLNGERHEFIAALDFIKFVRDNIDEIKGKEFTITGQIQKNEYKGKMSDRFQIQNMFEVTEEKKHQLRVTGEFFWNADGVDTADWKSEKKISFNGYTKEWMSKDHPSVYVPMSIVFDAGKLDFENEKHVMLFNYKLRQIGLEYADGKIKVNLKKKGYFVQSVICSYVNGAEVIDFSIDQLTPNQREAVELGLKTVDDFRPRGNIYGERVVMLKLIDFDGRDKFADGYVECDDSVKEFEGNIYAPATEESEEDFEKKMNPPEEEKKMDKEDDVSDEDLFG